MKLNEETIDKVCGEVGMIRLKVSQIPTWMDPTSHEGLEFRNGVVKSFVVVGMERDYDENVTSDVILKAIAIVSNSISEPAPAKIIKQDRTIEVIPLLPDFLTPALVAKWTKMSTIDRMLLFQKTPEEQIFQKPVSKTETVPYVKGNYMIREANAAFLFDWEFLQQGISIGTVGVCVYGILYANVDGKRLSRPAVGYEEINSKMTPQLAIKSATTDAIKKGLSLFGFNSDVYSGEV